MLLMILLILKYPDAMEDALTDNYCSKESVTCT